MILSSLVKRIRLSEYGLDKQAGFTAGLAARNMRRFFPERSEGTGTAGRA